MHTKNPSVIALTIINSVVQLLGVMVWGWPIGNIFLLLWIENVIITVIAVSRVATVREGPGKDIGGGRMTIAFAMALFCVVHGVFSMILAVATGLNLSPALFLFPFIMLVVRYSVEGIGRLRHAPRPETVPQAVGFATRRIIMLHFVIIACWFVMIFGLVGTTLFDVALPASPALLALVILLVIKTWAEVASLRHGPNTPSSWRFTTH